MGAIDMRMSKNPACVCVCMCVNLLGSLNVKRMGIIDVRHYNSEQFY